MALEKKRILKKIDIDLEQASISIAFDVIVMDGEEELARKRHRCAFCPGDIEAVKEYLGKSSGKEIDFLNKLWTKEVIKAHKAKQGE